MRKGFMRVILISICSAASAGAQAQTGYPAKPIRLVVPFAPGASNDSISRATADAMSPLLGQPIVVENRPGAGGMIGAENVARAAPDGYSLLNIQVSFVTNAAIREKMPYDVTRDFAYIGMMTKSPMILVVHPSMPVKSVKELVAICRKRPGDLNYGSSGTGGSNHLATELFATAAGIRITHVPYKGIALALTDLMGGHVQMVLTSLPSVLGQVKSGRVRALGVAGDRRSPFAPDIPTVAEGGVQYTSELWWGLAAPGKTPPETVRRLSETLQQALQTSALGKRYAAEGGEPIRTTPQAFSKFVLEEVEQWRQVAKKSGVTLR
ncbi:MAG TPA: tripartite tricarboxylate transporter substrate binding protein [Burkholderiales bacterium]|nr:tripartite tricarboxylate transporter substrate binding protein [Burkholderiales bacterium]